MKMPTEQRFWAKVDRSEGPDACWLWMRAMNQYGYGRFWDGERLVASHRYAYELMVGPIPDGLHIDHLCRTRACVNPKHLEPVTNQENCIRGERWTPDKIKDHCRYGHPYSGWNLYINPSGKRQCRECVKAGTARYRERRRAARREGAPV